MHGEIHVHSTRDVGSTFTFNIRVKNGEAFAENDTTIDPRGSAISQLTTQLGQPRILMVCQDRVKFMIESFIPWVQRLEHRSNVEEAITLAVSKAEEGTPYDCVILDSPLPNIVNKMIEAIEENPKLHNLRILLLIAPTVDNIRRHLANSAISTISDDGSTEIVQSHHIFHRLVTRLSKPVRRLRLLNVLVKVLAESAVSALVQNKTTDSSQVISSKSRCATPVGGDLLTSQLNVGLVSAAPSSYSRQNQQGFSPEELAIFKGQRILVAEDNVIAQRLIVKQLAKLGFVVDKCNNGFECFETWKARGPGYFILAWIDHHMPKCDGLEATRLIRKHEKEMNHISALPIIALTGKLLIKITFASL